MPGVFRDRWPLASRKEVSAVGSLWSCAPHPAPELQRGLERLWPLRHLPPLNVAASCRKAGEAEPQASPGHSPPLLPAPSEAPRPWLLPPGAQPRSLPGHRITKAAPPALPGNKPAGKLQPTSDPALDAARRRAPAEPAAGGEAAAGTEQRPRGEGRPPLSGYFGIRSRGY